MLLPATEGAIKGAIAGGSTGGLLTLLGGLSVMLIPGVGISLAVESLLTVMAGTGISTAVCATV
jgi:histidyl-tRNA synthetase